MRSAMSSVLMSQQYILNKVFKEKHTVKQTKVYIDWLTKMLLFPKGNGSEFTNSLCSDFTVNNKNQINKYMHYIFRGKERRRENIRQDTRQRERIPDLLKTQTHCGGHSEQGAYVCSSMARTPQDTAPMVSALFKQHGPKANKCKTYQVCFLFCLYFYPFSHSMVYLSPIQVLQTLMPFYNPLP